MYKNYSITTFIFFPNPASIIFLKVDNSIKKTKPKTNRTWPYKLINY